MTLKWKTSTKNSHTPRTNRDKTPHQSQRASEGRNGLTPNKRPGTAQALGQILQTPNQSHWEINDKNGPSPQHQTKLPVQHKKKKITITSSHQQTFIKARKARHVVSLAENILNMALRDMEIIWQDHKNGKKASSKYWKSPPSLYTSKRCTYTHPTSQPGAPRYTGTNWQRNSKGTRDRAQKRR